MFYTPISHEGVSVGVLIGGAVIYFRVWYEIRYSLILEEF